MHRPVSSETQSLPPKPTQVKPPSRFLPQWLWAFWKFSRPHTIVGTTLSVLGIAFMAMALRPIPRIPVGGDGSYLSALLIPLLICLAGNVYIVGLNQLEDIAIDRINKPHLPLASEEFSRSQGRWIVALMGGIAVLGSAFQGVYLMAMVWVSVLIGTAYSQPPVRLKRFPLMASLCIFTVRGVVVNLGLFLHFQQRWGGATGLPPAIWALTAFVLLFTFAIAIFKDIPDLEGDRRYNISTFTLRLGAVAVFNLARWVLTLCYGGMIVGSLALPDVHAPLIMITHLGLLALLWIRSLSVDLGDRPSIARFYQFIWKLFFLEYLLFPLACWVAAQG